MEKQNGLGMHFTSLFSLYAECIMQKAGLDSMIGVKIVEEISIMEDMQVIPSYCQNTALT